MSSRNRYSSFGFRLSKAAMNSGPLTSTTSDRQPIIYATINNKREHPIRNLILRITSSESFQTRSLCRKSSHHSTVQIHLSLHVGYWTFYLCRDNNPRARPCSPYGS